MIVSNSLCYSHSSLMVTYIGLVSIPVFHWASLSTRLLAVIVSISHHKLHTPLSSVYYSIGGTHDRPVGMHFSNLISSVA